MEFGEPDVKLGSYFLPWERAGDIFVEWKHARTKLSEQEKGKFSSSLKLRSIVGGLQGFMVRVSMGRIMDFGRSFPELVKLLDFGRSFPVLVKLLMPLGT